MKVTTEVCRIADAPWAPDLPGARWAWRVIGLGGNTIVGATTGTQKDAAHKAELTARRLRGLQGCGLASKAFRIDSKPATQPEAA